MKGKGSGSDTGGEGQGRGGDPGEKATDTGLVKTRLRGEIGKGKIVGAWTVKGEPPKGQVRAEYEEAAESAAEEAMDALSKQRVPAAQRDYVRDYFDAIRGKNAATPEK
jgi:hypothetical protein